MKEIYRRLSFLKTKAPTLLRQGEVQDVREVLRCRMWLDKNIQPSHSGLAWWMLIRGDISCAQNREALAKISLAESIQLGATCNLSWHSLVWQRSRGRDNVELMGNA